MNLRKKYLPLRRRLGMLGTSATYFIYFLIKREMPTFTFDEDDDGNMISSGKWSMEHFSLRDNLETTWAEFETALLGYVFEA